MKRNFKFLLLLILIAFFSITSCYYDVESELYPDTATCDSSNTKFSTFVSPLIKSKCATSGCHNAISSSSGINLEGYSSIKNYITRSQSTFFGSIKHSSNFSAMPKGGTKLSNCDITKLQLWVDGGMLNN